MKPVHEGQTVRFDVENVGGIDETSAEIPPGVTVLSGKNATNRTSFLQSIMAAMGSSNATLKGDADEGVVELHFGDQHFERSLRETADGGVQITGDGLVDDPDVADLFAFLLETNTARRAVARGEDLRQLIMRPVDIEDIRTEIQRLTEEKAKINDELATIESLKRELPDLEQQRSDLQSKIEQKRAELSELEERIDETDHTLEETRKDHDRLEEKLDELREKRSELAEIRETVDTKEERIERLTERRQELGRKRDDLDEQSTESSETLEERIDRLRREKRSLKTQTSDLQSVIQFNEEMLEDDESAVMNAINDAPDTVGDVTGQLLGRDDSVTCWTCGSSVASGEITAMLDDLRDIRQEKLEDITDIESELDELKTRQQRIERRRQKRAEIDASLEEVETKLTRQRRLVDDLTDRRSGLTSEVETLETEVDGLRSEDFDELLDLHKEANQLEFEIEQLESERASVTEELDAKEATIRREDDLREQRDELLDQLSDLRTRIDQIEEESVEQFNDHMDAILEILGYDNLERIWIERLQRTVQDGRETVEQTAFELHVVRSTDRGTAYEDTIDHLSESEREVTGLIFALAGYLVHDLYETVPFMLLDSLEAIDADRIAALVDYFAEYVDYLVVALLEEDAQALDDAYNRVYEI